MPRFVNDHNEVEALADQMQAHGPDEFPRDYYLFLADVYISDEEDE